jgi:hypothetical protein
MPGRAHKLNWSLTGAKFISPSKASFGGECVGRRCDFDVMGIIDIGLPLEASTWIVLYKS